ncbi:MAG TPA: galactokinase [Ktedonobacterales bacterium]
MPTISDPLMGGTHPDMPEPARQALTAYRQHLADPADTRPITIAWASGRVNLIGEHTDYNEGFVLPVAIDRVVALAGRPTPGATSHCYSVHHRQRAYFHTGPDALAATASGSSPVNLPLWIRYVRGVIAEFGAQPGTTPTPAFDAAIAGDVPVGGGMSSSAALEVTVATFAAALGGPTFPPMTTAHLCQLAEQKSTGAMVGIMDQAASCLGRPDHAMLLDCRSLAYDYIPMRLPGILLAVYDTGVSHSHASSGYNERRRQCEEAVAILAQAVATETPARAIHSLRDITADDLARHGHLLSDVLLRRARHVVSENARVHQAVEALTSGDIAALGALLYASHASLRDDYEVSCPELDAVVEIARAIPGVVGARMMGGGFGGSALILVRNDAQSALESALATQYPIRTNRTGAMHICQVAGGPHHITVPH